MGRRERGTGGLYQRGDGWWMKFYDGGQPFRKSCNTKSKAKAHGMLLTRLKSLASGEQFRPGIEKILVSELAGDFLQNYRINGLKSLDDAESRWRLHLQPWFGHVRASRVSSDLVNRYIEHRQTETAKNATINRELSALRRMYSLGIDATPPKVSRIPKLHKLPENNVRRGFITDDPYEKLAEICGAEGLWLRAMLEVGYTYGWRDGEVRKLRVCQIELENHRILLDVGSTKNGDGRTVKFKAGSKLEQLLTECCRGKQLDDFAFTRGDGSPIRDFRGTWWRVCCETGVSRRICRTCQTTVDEKLFCPMCGVRRLVKDVKTVGLLFHDLRRSAARNARTSGVAEGIIMKMGGWKTRSVFDRYAIIAESDMDDAIDRIEARRAQIGHNRQESASLIEEPTNLKEPFTHSASTT